MTLPLLKYPGGKRKVAGNLLDALRETDDFSRIVDPMAGAGSYPLAARARGIPCAFFDPGPFAQMWWGGLIGKDACWYFRDEVQYYNDIIERNPPSVVATVYQGLRRKLNNGEARPSDMYVLNRLGFNGLVRYNKRGSYNVPPGDHVKKAKPVPVPDLEDVLVHGLLARVGFDLPGLAIGPRDLVILDPPYLGGFTAYTPAGWSAANLTAYIEGFKRDGPALIVVHEHTGGEAQRIIEAAGLTLEYTWNRAGTISSDPSNRGPREEGVWIWRRP